MLRIDAHQHFWKYDPVEYAWIDDGMKEIRRDFLPGALAAEIRAASVDGVVAVQARQTTAETAWLLELAATHDFIKAVVGWVPLISAELTADLERFARYPKLRGVRHVLQGEADDRYMLRADFQAGLRALRPFDLVYDLLIVERQLPPAVELVDAHPDQVFVLDHCAKPRIDEGIFEPWNKNMRELAKRENVFCKLSGLVTEARSSGFSAAGLSPYVETVLAAFGPKRTMFGSDWPVCLVACSYEHWVSMVEGFTANLSADEQAQVFGETAAAAYGFAASVPSADAGTA